VPREDEFAPVKNAPGAGSDCAETARAALSALCTRRLLAAGGSIAPTSADAPAGHASAVVAAGAVAAGAEQLLEISPLVSYAGEGLEPRVAGRTFALPALIEEEQQ
jgi:UDP-N-acetylglucosamine/UDP-N-acetylgalactosamine diphosphorylase